MKTSYYMKVWEKFFPEDFLKHKLAHDRWGMLSWNFMKAGTERDEKMAHDYAKFATEGIAGAASNLARSKNLFEKFVANDFAEIVSRFCPYCKQLELLSCNHAGANFDYQTGEWHPIYRDSH